VKYTFKRLADLCVLAQQNRHLFFKLRAISVLLNVDVFDISSKWLLVINSIFFTQSSEDLSRRTAWEGWVFSFFLHN